MTRFTPALLVATAVLIVAGGCSRQTLEGAAQDTARNVQTAERGAREAERTLRPHVAKLQKEVKPALTKAEMGLRVKTALTASEKLPKTIRVDADETGVRLRGRVRTRAEKVLAGRIAEQTLGEGKTVRNQIEVKPGSPGD
jgi:osmotically-inducible protein OsmY